MTTQDKCVGAKKETNSVHENDVSKRHMTWWKNAWWIRVDSGPHMRTARGRRRIWRAARRAAEQARDDDRVEETRSPAEEAEGETWERKKGETDQTMQRKHFALGSSKCNTHNSSSGRADHRRPQGRIALPVINVKDFALVQPYRLPPSLAKGLHRCRICCF